MSHNSKRDGRADKQVLKRHDRFDSIQITFIKENRSNFKMARLLASASPSFSEKRKQGSTYCSVTYMSGPEYILAFKVLELIGRRETTTVLARGRPVFNVRDLLKVLGCFAQSTQARNQKSYCTQRHAESASVGARMNLEIQITFQGLRVLSDTSNVAHVRKRTYIDFPCRSAFNLVVPQPESPSDWPTLIEKVAAERLCNLCPLYMRLGPT